MRLIVAWGISTTQTLALHYDVVEFSQFYKFLVPVRIEPAPFSSAGERLDYHPTETRIYLGT